MVITVITLFTYKSECQSNKFPLEHHLSELYRLLGFPRENKAILDYLVLVRAELGRAGQRIGEC